MVAYRGIQTGLTKSTDHPSIRSTLGFFQRSVHLFQDGCRSITIEYSASRSRPYKQKGPFPMFRPCVDLIRRSFSRIFLKGRGPTRIPTQPDGLEARRQDPDHHVAHSPDITISSGTGPTILYNRVLGELPC